MDGVHEKICAKTNSSPEDFDSVNTDFFNELCFYSQSSSHSHEALLGFRRDYEDYLAQKKEQSV
eukprot:CAMPEP_0201922464 /NCGR_PEP_ID=MMETSP0903-20130614/10496_1 /ASSEMBLY_ACC=CAM_ASM_000552 /TAXON_ID=420261 /ORGANISM="Thalassiosira antarctica, Strain CCMP982" /LENGTH=63 /DNA_ID=CAMNT_0048459609 /DNA_START=175 /DNA_END=366 /DNA_ORIENTATION=-